MHVCMYTQRLAFSEARILNELLVGRDGGRGSMEGRGDRDRPRSSSMEMQVNRVGRQMCTLLLAAGAARVYDMRYYTRVRQNSREM